MRITWLISSAMTQAGGQWYSPLASVRYRVLAPARYLEREGHLNQFLRSDQPLSGEEVARATAADVVVVSKVLARGSVDIVRQAQLLGARVVVDLCDDHFDSPDLGPTYFELCRLADRVTASTAAMRDTICRRTGKRAALIDDPFEGPAAIPRFEPRRPTRLLWFGHPVNFDTVADMVPKLGVLARTLPLRLQVVSNPTGNGIREYLEQVNRQYSPGLTTDFTVWSPEATWQAMADCDLVVVPSLPSAKKLVKSPNRVVEPLRAGRFVVAYPLPSYVELADFLWLGENMAEGIAWALANPEVVRRRITDGQAHIDCRFSPLAIGRAWEAVLTQTAECDRQAA